MKKFVSVFLVLALLCSASALAQGAFPAFDDYVSAFEAVSASVGIDQTITQENTTYEDGESTRLYTTVWSDTLAMTMAVPLDSDELLGVSLTYFPDGTEVAAYGYLYTVCEIAITLGTIESFDEMNDFFAEIELLDHQTSGDTHAAVVGAYEYSYEVYDDYYLFYVFAADME